MMKRAVIVGSAGQDGRILWDQLAETGFSLVGISRGGIRTKEIDWNEPVDIRDANAVDRFVARIRPDQIYYLAAHHHSSQDMPDADSVIWDTSWHVHVHGFRNFLGAVASHIPGAKVFYASSARVFGCTTTCPQTEHTPIQPACVYGVTKAAGMLVADYYRREHRLQISCGILYNHESTLRDPQFLSQRVVDGIAQLRAGRIKHFEIGRLDTKIDWGYAPDYTRAMQLMLDVGASDNFIVATGEQHSVSEILDIAAHTVGVDWRGRVVERPDILQRAPLMLCGDASRLRDKTRWFPTVDFRTMIEIMARAAVARLRAM